MASIQTFAYFKVQLYIIKYDINLITVYVNHKNLKILKLFSH